MCLHPRGMTTGAPPHKQQLHCHPGTTTATPPPTPAAKSSHGYTVALPEKLVNATCFYCDTQNFVAIRRFSATVRDFGCVRMTCCNQNLSVTIKILLVAIYRRYHNTYFLSLQQGGVFTTEKNVLHVR